MVSPLQERINTRKGIKKQEMAKIVIIGAGAWGTAFAIHLARKGCEVLLWVYEKELYKILVKDRENRYYLPGIKLPDKIDFTDRINNITGFSDDVVVATPSFAMRRTLGRISDRLKDKRILILTKGFETKTRLLMSEVAHELLGNEAKIAVLSGPSFAREVADRAFTSVVVASRNKKLSSYFQGLVNDNSFRVYTSADVIGVELGGAMKNVMAIGAGIIEGLSLGTNTKAAFVTRALAEIKRLGRVLGTKETTFMGLSGMGDLVLTSYGALSRNRAFGLELAKGYAPEEIIKSQSAVVEGYFTVKAAYSLSRILHVEMPITEELYKIIYRKKSIRESLRDIRNRALKDEDI